MHTVSILASCLLHSLHKKRLEQEARQKKQAFHVLEIITISFAPAEAGAAGAAGKGLFRVHQFSKVRVNHKLLGERLKSRRVLPSAAQSSWLADVLCAPSPPYP
eukprot:scaffold21769_cov22-Tisochrysis_lutea.AAC.1